MKKENYVLLFFIGGTGYGILEIFWRGYTHPTMLFAGGICFCLYYTLCRDTKDMPQLLRCGIGAVLITCTELIFGVICNVFFKLHVWDYSHLPFSFYGQICLPYFLLWWGLCAPLGVLCRKLEMLLQKL